MESGVGIEAVSFALAWVVFVHKSR
jgi:hypothetical protein